MLPINPNRFEAALNAALAKARKGDGAAALAALEALEQSFPDRAEAPFHKGGLLRRAGRLSEAAAAFERAARIAPRQGQIWEAWADAISDTGDKAALARARRLMKEAGLTPKERKALVARMTTPRKESQRVSLGVPAQEIARLTAMLARGELGAVEAKARALAAKAPQNEILRLLLGLSLKAQGKMDAAEEALRAALKLAPDYPEAAATLAEILIDKGALDEAGLLLARAHAALPNSPLVLSMRARYQAETGAFRAADETAARLLALEPGNLSARLIHAQAMIERQQLPEALAEIDRVLAKAPEEAGAWILKARVLGLMARSEEGCAAARKALDLAPDSADAREMLMVNLMNLGEFSEARAVLAEAIETGNISGQMYRLGAKAGKLEKGDPVLAAMESAWQAQGGAGRGRAALGFALAKAHDDLGDRKAAWAVLSEANEIMRGRHPHDPAQERRDFAAITGMFGPDTLARVAGLGYEDDRTLFVSGLPRSGTSLVEQILASHPEITGGGELALFNARALETVAGAMQHRAGLETLPEGALSDLGASYHRAVGERLPDAARVTDKSVGTFQTMGLIWAALPNARIVTVRRDPRATLFSMLRNQFAAGTHEYAYDQQTLVERYRLYLDYLDFWRRLAPERMFEIGYEALVADPEPEIRRLLDFCALDWDPACLSFHETRREVNTLSGQQVRQPLYQSSVAAWKAYERELAPMLEALDALEAERG